MARLTLVLMVLAGCCAQPEREVVLVEPPAPILPDEWLRPIPVPTPTAPTWGGIAHALLLAQAAIIRENEIKKAIEEVLRSGSASGSPP